MKAKKHRLILLSILLLYCFLLAALVLAESSTADSGIQSIGDAIWYSIVTLTTVGYGDLYPVTAVGRIVGIILVLCSLGLLSALITGVMTSFTGYAIPLYKLRRQREKTWNIYLEDTEISRTMAEEMLHAYPYSIAIFFTKNDRTIISVDSNYEDNVFYVQGSMRWLHAQHSGKKDINVFCFSDNGWENYRIARQYVHDFRMPVYCLTEIKSDKRVPNLKLYDPVEGLGRYYWMQFPVRSNEKRFIFVGCNNMGGSVFERGLQNNIFEPDRGIDYIVAGDSTAFRKMHYKMFGDRNGETKDTVTFYDSLWEIDPDMIYEADRIIICMDQESDNLSIYQKLVTHYATKGVIHVYTNSKLQRHRTRTFGHLRDIYNPVLVVQDRRNNMAMKMHELYRKNTTKPTTDWKGLSEYQKQSNIAAADHLAVKCRLLLGDEEFDHLYARKGYKTVLREAYDVYQKACKDPAKKEVFRNIEHNRWRRFLILYNWDYEEVRDNTRRKHHLMVPFAELPESEQTKDDNAWKLIGEVSKN